MVNNQMVMRAAKTLLVAINKVSDEALPAKIASTCRHCAAVAAVAVFVIGWLPVAGAMIATIVSAIAVWTMYVKINTAIQIPFSRNLIKSILVAIGTNLVAYFATILVATMIAFVPGIGSLVAAFAMSVGTYAITLASAYVYLNVLAKIFGKEQELNPIDINSVNQELGPIISDDEMKEIIQNALKKYCGENG